MTNLEMDKILALVHKLISRSPVPRGGRSFSLDFSIRRVEDTSKDLGRLCIANGTIQRIRRDSPDLNSWHRHGWGELEVRRHLHLPSLRPSGPPPAQQI
uniref:Uncharacterized protein n=1 Tax=Aegilops tauschii subsp. strangulata TaxID=200361 RepID=A0A453R526_AEGTS